MRMCTAFAHLCTTWSRLAGLRRWWWAMYLWGRNVRDCTLDFGLLRHLLIHLEFIYINVGDFFMNLSLMIFIHISSSIDIPRHFHLQNVIPGQNHHHFNCPNLGSNRFHSTWRVMPWQSWQRTKCSKDV